MQIPFSPLSFGKSVIKNPFSRSRERLSGIFVANGKSKKTKSKKKQKKHL